MMAGFKSWRLSGAAVLGVVLAPGLAGAEAPPMSALNPNAPAPQGFIGPTFEGPWRFRAALNGWLPTVPVTVSSPGFYSKTTLSLRWIINHLKYIFPVDLEARKGPFGVFYYAYAYKIAGDSEFGHATIDWKNAAFLMDVGLSYELGRWALGDGPRAPELTVEPFAGARLIHMPIDLDLDLGPLGFSKITDLSNNVPVVGLRTYWDLTEHWNLLVKGDYGGFGVDDNHQTWQVVGLIGYRWAGWGVHWNLQAGYRAMRFFDLRKGGARVEMDWKGPDVVFGVEF